MKLSDLSSEPKLIEITIDDKDILETYGEPLTFYTYDRQPLDVFLRLANIDGKNTVELINIVKTLILDEKGKPVITDKNTLPSNVMMKAITKVTEQLGK